MMPDIAEAALRAMVERYAAHRISSAAIKAIRALNGDQP